jgi:hypothetical protein
MFSKVLEKDKQGGNSATTPLSGEVATARIGTGGTIGVSADDTTD